MRMIWLAGGLLISGCGQHGSESFPSGNLASLGADELSRTERTQSAERVVIDCSGIWTTTTTWTGPNARSDKKEQADELTLVVDVKTNDVMLYDEEYQRLNSVCRGSSCKIEISDQVATWTDKAEGRSGAGGIWINSSGHLDRYAGTLTRTEDSRTRLDDKGQHTMSMLMLGNFPNCKKHEGALTLRGPKF